jgi:hypothetical protein
MLLVLYPTYQSLTNLPKKDAFHWSIEAQQAFEHLKEPLASTPMLSTPKFTLPFIIECDSSGFGLGVLLL